MRRRIRLAVADRALLFVQRMPAFQGTRLMIVRAGGRVRAVDARQPWSWVVHARSLFMEAHHAVESEGPALSFEYERDERGRVMACS